MAQDVNHIHELENFVQEALDFLPEEFLRNAENFNKLMTIFLSRLQIVDQSFVRLADYRRLSLAEGVNLDEIGAQLSIAREGLDDDNYRALLTIRTFSTANTGTRPSLITILNNLLGKDNFYTYKGDNYRFDLAIRSPCFDPATTTNEILDLLPLPTYFRMVQMEGSPFGFDGDDDCDGFRSVHESFGAGAGSWCGLLYADKTQ